jgi:hypothetical protein
VLQYHFNWKTISVAAAMTLWNFYFQVFEKTIAKEQVVEFLAYLVQQLPGPLLIVWDRLPAHRSRFVERGLEPDSDAPDRWILEKDPLRPLRFLCRPLRYLADPWRSLLLFFRTPKSAKSSPPHAVTAMCGFSHGHNKLRGWPA